WPDVVGNRAVESPGSSVGPSRTPISISPTTGGCLNRRNSTSAASAGRTIRARARNSLTVCSESQGHLLRARTDVVEGRCEGDTDLAHPQFANTTSTPGRVIDLRGGLDAANVQVRGCGPNVSLDEPSDLGRGPRDRRSSGRGKAADQ